MFQHFNRLILQPVQQRVLLVTWLFKHCPSKSCVCSSSVSSCVLLPCSLPCQPGDMGALVVLWHQALLHQAPGPQD